MTAGRDRNRFSGVFTAIVTPFLRGEVDERSLRRLLRWQLQQGVRGFVIGGTTGESPTLLFEELKHVYDIAAQETDGQVPLIVGTGSNSTRRTIELTQHAESWGADAALLVTPYYNKPPQRGLIEHFRAVADVTKVPLILYNVPSRTITALAAETVAELSQSPRFLGIKEASGDLELLRKLIEVVPKDFLLTSGDDATCVDFVARGGHGVISVVSHIMGRELTQCMASGSAKDFSRYARLLKAVYAETNPIGIKAALYILGLIDSPELRLPLVTMSSPAMKELEAAMAELNLSTESQ